MALLRRYFAETLLRLMSDGLFLLDCFGDAPDESCIVCSSEVLVFSVPVFGFLRNCGDCPCLRSEIPIVVAADRGHRRNHRYDEESAQRTHSFEDVLGDCLLVTQAHKRTSFRRLPAAFRCLAAPLRGLFLDVAAFRRFVHISSFAADLGWLGQRSNQFVPEGLFREDELLVPVARQRWIVRVECYMGSVQADPVQ